LGTEGTEKKHFCLPEGADKQKPSAISWHGSIIAIIFSIAQHVTFPANAENISRSDSHFIQSASPGWIKKRCELCASVVNEF
jgi:hypothetical protein